MLFLFVKCILFLLSGLNNCKEKTSANCILSKKCLVAIFRNRVTLLICMVDYHYLFLFLCAYISYRGKVAKLNQKWVERLCERHALLVASCRRSRESA